MVRPSSLAPAVCSAQGHRAVQQAELHGVPFLQGDPLLGGQALPLAVPGVAQARAVGAAQIADQEADLLTPDLGVAARDPQVLRLARVAGPREVEVRVQLRPRGVLAPPEHRRAPVAAEEGAGARLDQRGTLRSLAARHFCHRPHAAQPNRRKRHALGCSCVCATLWVHRDFSDISFARLS